MFYEASLRLGLCVLQVVLAATSKLTGQDASVPADVKVFAAEYVAAFSAKDGGHSAGGDMSTAMRGMNGVKDQLR